MHKSSFKTGALVLASLLFYLLFSVTPAVAQQFDKTAETAEYIEYTLSNPSLHASPPFDEMVPYPKQGGGYQIVEQELVRVKKPSLDPEKLKKAWNLSGDDISLIQMLNPGIQRGKRVASMVVHVSRPIRKTEDQFIITRKLVVRINKPGSDVQPPARKTDLDLSGRDALTESHDHVFSRGQWYKIPIPKNGIYQITSNYLDNLGVDIGNVEPSAVEIWTTDGDKLPELNRTPRKHLTQIPIRIEGSSDGSFDQGDRILFYASSPHQNKWKPGDSTYTHKLHPYSTRNFVFLNIAGSDGKRLSPVNSNMNGNRTVREFRDFIWKEQELHKPSEDLKSGRKWFGERFNSQFGYRNKTIFSDTLPGFDSSDPVRLNMNMVARSTRISSFNLELNNKNAGEIRISSIYRYNWSQGMAAQDQGYITNLSVQAPNDILTLRATYNFTNSKSIGFVDWIEVTASRSLTAEDGYLYYYAPRDGGNNQVGTYLLKGFNSEPLVMDITDPTQPKLLSVEARNNSYGVDYFTDPHRRFIAQTRFLNPPEGTSVANQNLHGVSGHPDYLIITAERFRDAARELANYRQQHDGLKPLVATQEQVFNEFSAGVPDVIGLRDFVKYFYDRALDSGVKPPQYLLFFGNTSYDYKENIENARIPNLVFTFQSKESLSRDNSYGSDDYFGMLDPDEGEWTQYGNNERVDIGIGRISVTSRQKARMIVNKLKAYEKPENRGPWRNKFTFTADDGLSGDQNDRDLHLLNADGTAVRMNRNKAGIRINKVYEFAYPVENTASGRRRPQATDAFIQSINEGTLVINYSGHGNEQTLSGERLFHSSMIPRLHNTGRPTIFVTATCSFGRYDDVGAQCGAEKLVSWEQGGAIAAFTTTRVVYTSPSPNQANNFSLNIKLSREMVEKDSEGRPARLGDIYRETKNSSVGSAFNSRKFILLGDPAMRIGLPQQEAALTKINQVDIANRDTTIRLQALDKVKLSGMLRNEQGQPLTNYNGEVNITVYDSKRYVQLPDEPWMPNCFLKGDPYYEGCKYEVQNDVLFNGRASVENGHFNSQFIIPKDINASDKKGRVLIYAGSNQKDAGGATSRIQFKGLNQNAANDNKGPSMDVYLNSDKFVNGNMVGSTPRLIVEMDDKSGINTTGTGVGHEIIAKIDTKPRRTIVLNEFYTSKLNDFTEGRVEYQMQKLPEGKYNLTVQAWDVYNNPSQKEISFEVQKSDELVIDNLYNYPNPMNNFTRFIFEHNQAGNMLDVNIRIYTLSGRPVAELEKNFVSTDSYGIIKWNGRGADHDRLANGTYIYKVHIKAQTPNGIKTKEKMEKLVIIQ